MFEPHQRHCVVVHLARHIYPSLVLVQPRKTRPYITKRLLMGRKELLKSNLYVGFKSVLHTQDFRPNHLKLNKCCVLTTAESRVKIHPCGFSCCTFQGDGSVVVDSLFLIAPDVCGFLCLVPVFVMQYLMSFLVFFTVEERAGCFTLIVLILTVL